jgi:hypothetical protein
MGIFGDEFMIGDFSGSFLCFDCLISFVFVVFVVFIDFFMFDEDMFDTFDVSEGSETLSSEVLSEVLSEPCIHTSSFFDGSLFG